MTFVHSGHDLYQFVAGMDKRVRVCVTERRESDGNGVPTRENGSSRRSTRTSGRRFLAAFPLFMTHLGAW